MGLIPKEVNLPHQMLFSCSFFGGAGRASLGIETTQILPLPHYIDCVIVQVFLGRHFCDTVSQQTLWPSIPYNLSIPSSFMFLGFR